MSCAFPLEVYETRPDEERSAGASVRNYVISVTGGGANDAPGCLRLETNRAAGKVQERPEPSPGCGVGRIHDTNAVDRRGRERQARERRIDVRRGRKLERHRCAEGRERARR